MNDSVIDVSAKNSSVPPSLLTQYMTMDCDEPSGDIPPSSKELRDNGSNVAIGSKILDIDAHKQCVETWKIEELIVPTGQGLKTVWRRWELLEVRKRGLQPQTNGSNK